MLNVYIFLFTKYVFIICIYILLLAIYIYYISIYICTASRYIYIILSILYLSLVGGSVHVFFIFNQRHEVISIPDQGISQVNWSGGKLFALGAQGR